MVPFVSSGALFDDARPGQRQRLRLRAGLIACPQRSVAYRAGRRTEAAGEIVVVSVSAFTCFAPTVSHIRSAVSVQ